MKNVGFNKVANMTDVNVELDKIRRLLVNIPENSSGSTYELPVGSITAYAGTNIPTGYLNCDGSTVSRTVYADLFSAIGTTWGAGDGSTTFNIPDLRSATLRGVGTSTVFTDNTKVITLAQTIDDTLQGHGHDAEHFRSNAVAGGSTYPASGINGDTLDSVRTEGQRTVKDVLEYDVANNGSVRKGAETTGKARGVYYIIKALSSATVVNSTLPSVLGQYAYISPQLDVGITLVSGGGTLTSILMGKAVFSKTSNNAWYMDINAELATSSTARTQPVFGITGVTFFGASTSVWQSLNGDANGSVAPIAYIQAIGNTSNIFFSHASTAVIRYTFGGKLALASKPTGYGLPD